MTVFVVIHKRARVLDGVFTTLAKAEDHINNDRFPDDWTIIQARVQ